MKYKEKYKIAKIVVDDMRDGKGEGTLIINVRLTIWERIKLLFNGVFVVIHKQAFGGGQTHIRGEYVKIDSCGVVPPMPKNKCAGEVVEFADEITDLMKKVRSESKL